MADCLRGIEVIQHVGVDSEPRPSAGIAIVTPTPPTRPKSSPHAFRRLIEFKEIRGGDLGFSRRVSRKVYDGPAGAVLAFASVVSLHEPLLGALLRRGTFDVSRFGRILDIGSGAGQILGHLLKEAPPSATVVAADLSHRMLRRAQNRLKTKRASFVAADVTRLPFADGSFDCVTCGWVIEHLPDPVPGLREMRRVLRPGGSLLLLATEDTVTGALNSRTWKCRTYNRAELRASCEQSGLAWTRQFHLSPVHRLLRIGGIIVEAVRVDEPQAPSEIEEEQQLITL